MSPTSTSAAATLTSTDGEKNTTSSNVTLKTSDGETFEVAIDVISQSQTIKHMIEDDCANEFIPIPNVDGKVLSKVIEYCQKHHKSSDDQNVDEKIKSEIRQWDIEFVTGMEDSMKMDVIVASSYLEIKSLLDLTAQKIADMIKDYSLVKLRELFKVEKDFEEGEVERLKKEHGILKKEKWRGLRRNMVIKAGQKKINR